VPEIVATSVLPARRDPLVIRTDDGLRLVGELATPRDRAPVATMICLHPLPTHGGMMDSHLYRKAAWRLPALAGIAELRFSTDADLDRWAASRRPLTALVPQLDDYLRPDEARTRFARVPQAEVVAVDGAKHLWVGEPYVRVVLDTIVSRLVPGSSRLPTEWDGPMERWSDL